MSDSEEKTNNYFNISPFGQIGTLIAICLSWATHESIFWMVVNSIFGWLYVIYWGFEYSNLAEIIRTFIVGGL